MNAHANMLTDVCFPLSYMHTNTHLNRNKAKGSQNRSPHSQLVHTHAHICYKYVWITSKVLAHPLAKHFSPINHAAHESVGLPSLNPILTPLLLPAKALWSGNTPQIPKRLKKIMLFPFD